MLHPVNHLPSLSGPSLVDQLKAHAQHFGVRDLVVEISPTRGYRIVREGVDARGTLISRHALMGVLLALSVIVPDKQGSPVNVFWMEVMSA